MMRCLSIAALLAALCGQARADGQTVPLPDPAVDEPAARAAAREEAVFAGGSYWGVQLVVEHVRGGVSATAGYAGGTAATARYEIVSSGTTGHAESVQVVYDPARITCGRLLKVFFGVVLDPTELDRQGPDTGPQYRSELFATNAVRRRIADACIAQLEGAHVYARRIATRVAALPAFYPAEGYQQHFADRHPDDPCIVFNDWPELERLKREFPRLYR